MMPVSEHGGAQRDLLAELHEEQCAHGATLRRLDVIAQALIALKRDVEDFGSPRRHADALLKAERALDAWEAAKNAG